MGLLEWGPSFSIGLFSETDRVGSGAEDVVTDSGINSFRNGSDGFVEKSINGYLMT